ncbi:Oidioi.mRNA.OKI2018_I69.PAR.g11530.t1.cds [Oikopleura dioica]|uniref:Oidioi.mRNA.OKI2018_I69.PAR.g11530.t1.cds n=1 Tax=Oikopleura dioica TaxID=34765 RepID=A0ABN7S1W1_OIKDI|nr:Oidioi.mRNA.OKI2018_I69.PAR.g11530.t1.cds [Oikopleura dioica]
MVITRSARNRRIQKALRAAASQLRIAKLLALGGDEDVEQARARDNEEIQEVPSEEFNAQSSTPAPQRAAAEECGEKTKKKGFFSKMPQLLKKKPTPKFDIFDNDQLGLACGFDEICKGLSTQERRAVEKEIFRLQGLLEKERDFLWHDLHAQRVIVHIRTKSGRSIIIKGRGWTSEYEQ